MFCVNRNIESFDMDTQQHIGQTWKLANKEYTAKPFHNQKCYACNNLISVNGNNEQFDMYNKQDWGP